MEAEIIEVVIEILAEADLILELEDIKQNPLTQLLLI